MTRNCFCIKLLRSFQNSLSKIFCPKLLQGVFFVNLGKISAGQNRNLTGNLNQPVLILTPGVPCDVMKLLKEDYKFYQDKRKNVICCTTLRLEHVAYWLATCAQKPKVPSLSLAATYVQKWTICSNHPANVNWPSWFHFLILKRGLLVILIDCMIFLSPFLDVTRMSMSTVSFLTQPGSGILCILNAFLWPMI